MTVVDLNSPKEPSFFLRLLDRLAWVLKINQWCLVQIQLKTMIWSTLSVLKDLRDMCAVFSDLQAGSGTFKDSVPRCSMFLCYERTVRRKNTAFPRVGMMKLPHPPDGRRCYPRTPWQGARLLHFIFLLPQDSGNLFISWKVMKDLKELCCECSGGCYSLVAPRGD